MKTIIKGLPGALVVVDDMMMTAQASFVSCRILDCLRLSDMGIEKIWKPIKGKYDTSIATPHMNVHYQNSDESSTWQRGVNWFRGAQVQS